MHDDRFEDELKHRLGGYTEEPDDALWRGIAAGVSSKPAGFGWLRWFSRGFLMSFAVVTVIVGDSGFVAQDTAQVSSSVSVEAAGQGSEPGRGEMAFSGLADQGQTASAVLAGDAGADVENGCGDTAVESDGNDSMDTVDPSGRFVAAAGPGDVAMRNHVLSARDAKPAGRRARADVGQEGFEARRSRAEVKQPGVAIGPSRLEQQDAVVAARRSKAETADNDKFQARRSRPEDAKRAAVLKPSRAEDQAVHRLAVAGQTDRVDRVSEKGVKVDGENPKVTAEVVTSDAVPGVVIDQKGSAGVVSSAGGRATSSDPVSEKRSAVVGDAGVVSGVPQQVKQQPVVIGDAGVKTDAADLEDDGFGTKPWGAKVRDGVGAGAAGEVKQNDIGSSTAAEDSRGVFGPPMKRRRSGDQEVVARQELQRVHDAGVSGPVAADTTPSRKRATARAEEQKGEDEGTPAKDPSRVSLYFTAMPTLGYQRVEANASDGLVVESFQKLSNFSSKRLGVRAEFGAEYAFRPRLKIFGGVLYYQRKQTIDYVVLMNGGTEYTTSGDTLTIEPAVSREQRSFEYELKNIGVQLGVNYVLWKQKFLHVAGTGIEFHKALNKISEAQRLQGFSTNPSTYVFYNLYYRVQYPAEGRLKAIFQPTLNYSLYLNRDMNAPFYVKPYGLGLNLGLTYNF